MVHGESFPTEFLYYPLVNSSPCIPFETEPSHFQSPDYADLGVLGTSVGDESGHHLPEPTGGKNHGSTGTKVRKKGPARNPIPRHKRKPHLKAELKRRGKIQRAFGVLETLVPDINHRPLCQESKSVKLKKVSEHCRRLQSDCHQREEVASQLRAQIHQLSAEIQASQSTMPVTGLRRVEKPPCHLDKMLDKYISDRVSLNWKFWIFSLLVRPLFASYSTAVSTVTMDTFIASVIRWAQESLSISALRPSLHSALRHVSLRSRMLAEPFRISQDIVSKMFRLLARS